MVMWTKNNFQNEFQSLNPLEKGNKENFETWKHVFSSLLYMCTSSFQCLSSLICAMKDRRIKKRKVFGLCRALVRPFAWTKADTVPVYADYFLLIGVLHNERIPDWNYFGYLPYMIWTLAQGLLWWLISPVGIPHC